MVKNPPAKQEMQVQSLGQEDTLEKEMAPHSSTLVEKRGGPEETSERCRRKALSTEQIPFLATLCILFCLNKSLHDQNLGSNCGCLMFGLALKPNRPAQT